MADKSLLTTTLQDHIMKKFMSGEKVRKIDNGFEIGVIKIEANHSIGEYSLTITPELGLIKAYFIDYACAEYTMFLLADMLESQEQSHIIDEIKNLP